MNYEKKMEKVNEQIEDYFEFEKKFESCTVEQLEEVILAHWDEVQEVDQKLKDYMAIRQWKINDAFEWSPENMEKFLSLNQQLISCFEKIKKEAEAIIQTLQKRIDGEDDFLNGFYIDACVTPYIYVPDEVGTFWEAENGMEMILSEALNEFELPRLDWISKVEDLNDIIYLNRNCNCNKEPHFKGKFEGHFISHAMHDLYDHSCWSFSDIIRINKLWTEIKVIHQHIE